VGSPPRRIDAHKAEPLGKALYDRIKVANRATVPREADDVGPVAGENIVGPTAGAQIDKAFLSGQSDLLIVYHSES